MNGLGMELKISINQPFFYPQFTYKLHSTLGALMKNVECYRVDGGPSDRECRGCPPGLAYFLEAFKC